MRISHIAIAVVLVAAASSTSARPAAAGGSAHWCYSNNDPAYVDCSQPSFEMCLFSTYGAGGYCYLDATYRPPYRAEAQSWRRQAYAEPTSWTSGPSNWRYGAQPTYSNWRYGVQPTYYASPYASSYGSWRAQPAYMNPGYMNPAPVNARPGVRWCYANNDPGYVDCSQPSFEMCMFTSFGAGGNCYPEQAYFGPSRLRAAALHARHHLVHNERAVAMGGQQGIDLNLVANVKPVANAAAAGKPSGESGIQTVAVADAVVTDAPISMSPVRAAPAISDLPRFNVEATCRQAAHIGLDADRDTASCLQDERDARDQLAREWNEFSAADRSSCKRLTGSTGGGTYTELVTCLEMRQFARGADKANGSLMAVSR